MKLQKNQYFKAFDRDMKCRGFQYEEGKEYSIDGSPILCEKGFHFCKDLVLTLGYYPVKDNIAENRYAVIETLGEVIWEERIRHKGVTNHIRIVRVLTDDEVLNTVDDQNNSGKLNSGNRNSGDFNSGNNNSGNSNSGNNNSGNNNSGNRNSGNSNSGDSNSGDFNSGNNNSGNWNSCNYESGHFNDKLDDTVRVFGKLVLRSEWDNAYKPAFLFFGIDSELGYKGSFKRSYEQADPEDRAMVKELPGFDAEIFFNISGIDLR